MSAIARVRAVFGRLLTAFGLLAGGILLAVMVLVVANALLRYGANAPIAGSLEMTEGALPLIVFLSLAATQYEGGHIKVSLLTRRLPARFARVVLVFTLLTGALFFAWASWAGWLSALQSWGFGEIERGSIRYPIWPIKLAVATGLTALSLQFLIDALFAAVGGALPDTDPEIVE